LGKHRGGIDGVRKGGVPRGKVAGKRFHLQPSSPADSRLQPPPPPPTCQRLASLEALRHRRRVLPGIGQQRGRRFTGVRPKHGV
jgi:hypothetical protein